MCYVEGMGGHTDREELFQGHGHRGQGYRGLVGEGEQLKWASYSCESGGVAWILTSPLFAEMDNKAWHW